MPKEDPKPRRESRERGSRDDRDSRRRDNRGGRNERLAGKSKVARTDVDWQNYRLEVGKEHGAKPGDIVGAIANEVSLDSSYIGAINLHERHSYVQLPKGMPSHVFKKLKAVRVRKQSLEISVADVAVVAEKPRKRERAKR